jgi:hypothetical protein|tara:strand:- start:6809 stop:7117 length:309 start_codon:yes stop_codon:yes gene_type:complete
MAYIDPYEGTKKGVLAKFTFKRLEEDRAWDNGRGSKDVDTFYNDEYAVGFEGDLSYEYNVERFDEDAMDGNAWVWLIADVDVEALKAHSSFVGTKLLKDIRG